MNTDVNNSNCTGECKCTKNPMVTIRTKYSDDNSRFRMGEVIILLTEPENEYDFEAIRVYNSNQGQKKQTRGYVCNSIDTVIIGTCSAGRVLDKLIDNETQAVVRYVIDSYTAIAEVMLNK